MGNRILWGVRTARPRHDIHHDQNKTKRNETGFSTHIPRPSDFISPDGGMDSRLDGLLEILSQDSDISNVYILSNAEIMKKQENDTRKHIAEKYLGKVNNDNDPNGASLAAVQETFKKFMSSSIKPSNSDSSGVVKHERKITAEMLGPCGKR